MLSSTSTGHSVLLCKVVLFESPCVARDGVQSQCVARESVRVHVLQETMYNRVPVLQEKV
jgi:hypothetical protein